jgi:hypothetical protein
MQVLLSVDPLLDRPCSVQRVSAVQLRVQLWSVDQQPTEAEESPLPKIRYQETSSENTAAEWLLWRAATK